MSWSRRIPIGAKARGTTISVNDAKTLSGRYELQERLGSGGMAEVYLGRDRVLGRTIAVKTLLTQFAGDPHFIARFRREAQSAAALNHPHIVGVYDTGSDDGTHYIVMEYIEGRTLREIIREEGPLLPERAAEIAGDVCSGLAFAHSHGIVHRDVKPANIMITKNGEVKVTDFGIARAASSETVTQTATVLGTAQYFSPEQAQAGPVDARSDIYSLGVVLYEMLTRQVPFTGSSPVAIAYKHVKEDPIPPSRLNADIPPAIEAIVMKALAKNPDNRYQNAQEMRQDLMRAAAGKPVHATPLMPPIEQTSIHTPAVSDQTTIIRRTGPAPADVRRRRRLGWTLMTFILLAIAGVVTWAILSTLDNPAANLVAVPKVEGLEEQAAKDALTAKGLRWTIDRQASDDIAVGIVISQDPPEGQELKEGEVVSLVISLGKGVAAVPDLKGMTKDQAIAALEDAGLKLGRVLSPRPSTVAEKDKVVAQSIAAGFRVERGTTVDIRLGSGPETASVPSVVGMSETEATSTLKAAGFEVTVVKSSEGICAFSPGEVCDQDPDGGTTLEKGKTVTITVGETGFPTDEPTPTPTET
ncbi:MAG: Stk1 family PASTA domain-containing Ser/Thr kinase [Actinomycetota bacterium]